MKIKAECLYYLVREMGGLGPKANDEYFEDILKNVRQTGLNNMCRLEVDALIAAAGHRGRIEELGAAVRAGTVPEKLIAVQMELF